MLPLKAPKLCGEGDESIKGRTAGDVRRGMPAMLSFMIALVTLMVCLMAASVLNVVVFFDRLRQAGADLPGGFRTEGVAPDMPRAAT